MAASASCSTVQDSCEDSTFVLVDPSAIKLDEGDVDDEAVHVELEKLTAYTVDHLRRWLLFRGDNLSCTATIKDTRIR